MQIDFSNGGHRGPKAHLRNEGEAQLKYNIQDEAA
jgi:hypothetical protein